MRIRMAFQQYEPGDVPVLIAAVDEYIEDSWGRIPDFYTEDLKKAEGNGEVREVFISIPDAKLVNVFTVPTVNVSVVD